MKFTKKYSMAIVGITGIVGQELLSLLDKRSFPVSKIVGLASQRSIGKSFFFHQKKHIVETVKKNSFKNIDIVFFCAGKESSKEYFDLMQNSSSFIVDLSSHFRMKKDVPLIIPEINGTLLKKNPPLVSSPNCIAAITSLAIYPIHKLFGIKRIILATYQAASGGGQKLLEKLFTDTKLSIEKKQSQDPKFYGFNVFPHDSKLLENAYVEEEQKITQEIPKILSSSSMAISAMAIRVPVIRSHSVFANIECFEKIDWNSLEKALKTAPGICFCEKNFPTPITSSGNEKVFIGRVRKDLSHSNSLEMWIVGDQLLKGAALNAVQIAEKYIQT